MSSDSVYPIASSWTPNERRFAGLHLDSHFLIRGTRVSWSSTRTKSVGINMRLHKGKKGGLPNMSEAIKMNVKRIVQRAGSLAAAANHFQKWTRGGTCKDNPTTPSTRSLIYKGIGNCVRQNQSRKNAHLKGDRRARSAPLIVDPTKSVPELPMTQAPMRKVHAENGGTRVDGVGRRFWLLELRYPDLSRLCTSPAGDDISHQQKSSKWKSVGHPWTGWEMATLTMT